MKGYDVYKIKNFSEMMRENSRWRRRDREENKVEKREELFKGLGKNLNSDIGAIFKTFLKPTLIS